MHISVSGPLFDGRAETELARFCREAEGDIADKANDDLHVAMGQTFRHDPKNYTNGRSPGYYESQVHVQQNLNYTDVTDGGVVYGPWLEGTGSRNQTTRFKGYALFRRVAFKIQGEAKEIAERTLARYRSRLG